MEDNHNQSQTFTPNLLKVSSDQFDFLGGRGVFNHSMFTYFDT